LARDRSGQGLIAEALGAAADWALAAASPTV